MRLDKYLSHAGMGTRKEVKLMIRKGHVFINGEVCKKDDTHIDEEVDHVSIDGEEITYHKECYIMLHKPQGVVSAVSDAQYETVIDLIDLPYRDLFPVGRLDIDTEGLLLICNDGSLSHALLTPKKHVAKKYIAKIAHPLSEEDIQLLESGTIVLDQEQLQPASIEVLEPCKVQITITQGKFHQVKRMFEAVKNQVVALKRVAMGSLVLDESLALGEWRFLSEEEVQALKGNV